MVRHRPLVESPRAPGALLRALAVAMLLASGAVAQAADDPATLAEAGRWDDLLGAAEQRLVADPDDAAALAWAGRAGMERARELEAGDMFSRDLAGPLRTRAIEQLGRAVALGGEDLPDGASEWWFLARWDGGEDRTLDADLEAAWERDGDAFAAHMRGWLAWDRLADPARSGGATRIPDADVLAWLERACDADPSRGAFRLAHAEALAATGDVPGATAAWRAALDTDAGVPELLDSLLAILPGAEHAEERLARLDELPRIGASAGAVAWARAHALDQLGRPEDAERAFAAVSEGRTSELDRQHARLLLRLDRPDEAVALLRQRAAAHDWDAFAALLDVADTLGGQRRWDASLAVYDLALSIEHRDERAARNRAITLWRAGRPDDARRAWQQVVDLLPGRADILNDAALAAAGAGDPAEERRLLEASAALPGSQDAKENLAAWHLTEPGGSRTEAVALLETVLEQEPERDRALYLWSVARRRP